MGPSSTCLHEARISFSTNVSCYWTARFMSHHQCLLVRDCQLRNPSTQTKVQFWIRWMAWWYCDFGCKKKVFPFFPICLKTVNHSSVTKWGRCWSDIWFIFHAVVLIRGDWWVVCDPWEKGFAPTSCSHGLLGHCGHLAKSSDGYGRSRRGGLKSLFSDAVLSLVHTTY